MKQVLRWLWFGGRQLRWRRSRSPRWRSRRNPTSSSSSATNIGYWNVSSNNRGMMGYRTPNIDRIGQGGAVFTDLYAQQSCTADAPPSSPASRPSAPACSKSACGRQGRAVREGSDACRIAQPQGYATGQFGKNHLGDRNEHLPTVHGFDEFFGNLYHLNAEQEPENEDYPKNPQFRAMFGPRGVLKCTATDTDDSTEEPRSGKWGKQKCQDTGPLTKKRMETVDEEFLGAAMNFIDRQQQGQEAVLRLVQRHPHAHLHASQAGVEGQDRPGPGGRRHGRARRHGRPTPEAARRPRHRQGHIVVWTTDNGAEVFSWPDGGTTPFHGEKNTSWKVANASRRDALAGRDQAGHRDQRHRVARRLGADAGIGGRAIRK